MGSTKRPVDLCHGPSAAREVAGWRWGRVCPLPFAPHQNKACRGPYPGPAMCRPALMSSAGASSVHPHPSSYRPRDRLGWYWASARLG